MDSGTAGRRRMPRSIMERFIALTQTGRVEEIIWQMVRQNHGSGRGRDETMMASGSRVLSRGRRVDGC